MGEYFEGFTPELIDFFIELKFNNSKEWFDNNRERYKSVLKDPMDLLGKEMSNKLMDLDSDIVVKPSVCRINRDVRFSKNKEPYRTCKWVTFKPQINEDWKEKPVFFFEIAPDGYTYGMGVYSSTTEYAAKYRNRIDANPEELKTLIEKYNEQKRFKIVGNSYKRKMGNKERYEGEIGQWYQMKDISFICSNVIDDFVFSAKIIDKVIEDFKIVIPFYRYLNSI